MKKIDPKIAAVINKQQKFIIPNVIIAGALAFYGAYLINPNFNFWTMILGMVFFAIFRFLIQEIYSIYLTKKYYQGNIEQMLHDAKEAINIMESEEEDAEVEEATGATELRLEILAVPDKIYGRFMDIEFYEWLDIKGNDGNPIRFVFKTTEDMSKGRIPEIAPGCILLPPGLVYEMQFTPASS